MREVSSEGVILFTSSFPLHILSISQGEQQVRSGDLNLTIYLRYI